MTSSTYIGITLIVLALFLVPILNLNKFKQLINKWKFKRKAKKFNKKFIQKVKELATEEENKLLLKATYFASLDVLRNENVYVDPEFTIVCDERAVKIKMSEILQILLKK